MFAKSLRHLLHRSKHSLQMNGKDLENNLYQDRNHTSVVLVDEEKGAVEVV